jgi:hypothetical protein
MLLEDFNQKTAKLQKAITFISENVESIINL